MPTSSESSRRPMYPGQSSYQDPGHVSNAYAGELPPRSNTAGGTRPAPQPRDIPPSHTETHDTDDLLDSYYDSSHPDEPDMPNFDAIKDAHNGAVDESLPGLEQKPKTSPPGSSGGQYAAYNPGSNGPSDYGSANMPNEFANAGFQFDIPSEGPPPQNYGNMGYDPYQQPMPAPNSPQQNGYPHDDYKPNGAPRPYRTNQPGMNEQAGMNRKQSSETQNNPDALPHHPTPFRPGHDKPPPVRQPANGPRSTPMPAPAPQQGQPNDLESQPVTHDLLRQLQAKVSHNPADYKVQLILAKKLVEAATVLIDDRMDMKTKAKTKERYVLDGHKIVKKLVQSGYPDAQFYLADCYGSGQLGLQPDEKEAFMLYQSAAKAGHAQAAYRVAVCCEIGAEEGGGTKRDPFKAVQWYKRAASLGDPPAMYKMGMIQLKGLLGQARSPREAISWLKRAAERADADNPHALHELALMYSSANGDDILVRDEQYASELFHQAAELGYKASQYRLGAAYEYGLLGCPVDNRQSIIYYTHAASQGEHQSELALSGWYLTGADGILQQSDTEAYLWARKAATAGLAKAEYAMGYFTETGIGATANLEDAKRWYWRAAGKLQ